MKARDMVDILSRMDPETEVLIPYCTPEEAGDRTTGPVDRRLIRLEKIKGKDVVVLGDTVQSPGPALNVHRLVRKATLRELREIAGKLSLETITRKPIPGLIRIPKEARGRPGVQQRILATAQTQEGQSVIVLIWMVETAGPADIHAARKQAQVIGDVIPQTIVPIIACLETKPGLELETMPVHVLAGAEFACGRCDAVFQTRRGMEIHVALETGYSESINGRHRYWENYQADLKKIAREARPRGEKESCMGCGTPFHCPICCAAG